MSWISRGGQRKISGGIRDGIQTDRDINELQDLLRAGSSASGPGPRGVRSGRCAASPPARTRITHGIPSEEVALLRTRVRPGSRAPTARPRSAWRARLRRARSRRRRIRVLARRLTRRRLAGRPRNQPHLRHRLRRHPRARAPSDSSARGVRRSNFISFSRCRFAGTNSISTAPVSPAGSSRSILPSLSLMSWYSRLRMNFSIRMRLREGDALLVAVDDRELDALLLVEDLGVEQRRGEEHLLGRRS